MRTKMGNLKYFLSQKVLHPERLHIVLFVAIGGVFGFVFVFATPAMRGPDEMAHFARAYQISEGHVLPQKIVDKDNFGGYVPQSALAVGQASYDDLVSSRSQHPDTIPKQLNKELLSAKLSTEKNELAFPGSASYAPVMYASPVAAIVTGRVLDLSIGVTLSLVRVYCLLTYLAIVALSLWVLRKSALKWLVFVIALTPTALYQASVISTDGLLNALSFCLFSAIMWSFISAKPLTTFYKSIIGAVAILLPLAKPNYALLSLGVLLIPGNKIAGNNKKALIYKGVVIASAVLVAAIWLTISSKTTPYLGSVRGDGQGFLIDPANQLKYIVTAPLDFIVNMTRTLVQNETSYTKGVFNSSAPNAPIASVVGIACLALIAGLGFDAQKIRRRVLVFGALSAMIALSIFVSLYMIYTPLEKNIIDGVQGRYFLPLMPAIILSICVLIKIPIKIDARKSALLFSSGMFIVLLLSLPTYLMQFNII